MEKGIGEATWEEREGQKDQGFVDALFELFGPEFFEELPPEEIEKVIANLKRIEESGEKIPDEWLYLRRVLEVRGYLA